MPQPQLLLSLPESGRACQVRRYLQRQLPGCSVLAEPSDCEQGARCSWPHRLSALQAAQVRTLLEDAVQLLEHDRHAVRAAPLASLRRRLDRVLVELARSGAC